MVVAPSIYTICIHSKLIDNTTYRYAICNESTRILYVGTLEASTSRNASLAVANIAIHTLGPNLRLYTFSKYVHTTLGGPNAIRGVTCTLVSRHNTYIQCKVVMCYLHSGRGYDPSWTIVEL